MGGDEQSEVDGQPSEVSAKDISKSNIDTEKRPKDSSSQSKDIPKPLFQPKATAEISLPISLPSELWLAVLECPCTFPTDIFTSVMLNLVKNPNLTSSHLFRADILYDSEKDPTQALLKGLKSDFRPRAPEKWPGFELERTMVRLLIPRNPKLDRPIAQTCHFFRQQDDNGEMNLVIYIPHIDQEEDIPFYHPSVSQLAFLHTSKPGSGSLTLLYLPFTQQPLPPKLHRTALHLLTTLHKHGQGQLLGYQKRVHHDQIIPQPRYQNTYTQLKMKYGKKLSEQWVEVTDPGKHVFEDIGIAAFLIELWRDMYQTPGGGDETKPPFPGFIDIGCGNGLLVYILLSEGYPGSGFDARTRKTWSIFPEAIQANLTQQILVPSILSKDEKWHSGLFANPGTFIVSNHADELTPWTPLLAYLNNSSFIAIPCCSHDLSGARFRASASTRAQKEGERQAAETGSLKRTEAQKKMPSAYATLCSYISSLAAEVSFEPEEDVLRIPSTRNTCIIGRRRKEEPPAEMEERETRAREIVERELKKDIGIVAEEWIERAEKLMKKPSSGH